MANNRLYLFYGCMLSMAALAILFAIRIYRPSLLDIDAKWLIAAGVPILLVLIIGKYITKFKGFGLDIEIAAREELIDNPSVLTLLRTAVAKKKDDLQSLYVIPLSERLQYNVLEFIVHKKDYYEAGAVITYVKEMPNLRYFLMTNKHGKFIALMKIKRSIFKNDNNFQYTNEFIEKVEEGDFETYDQDVTMEYVYRTNSILETLETIRASGKKFIPVMISPGDFRLSGIVAEGKVEKYLANAVLKSFKNQPATHKEELPIIDKRKDQEDVRNPGL